MSALAFVLAALSAQEALPEKTLEALKAASVYVSGTSTLPTGTGSGFLIHKDGDTGYVVTNDHVVVGIASRDVLLTFFSGTANERRIPGKVVSTDEDRDLAVVKFEMKGMPEPLVLSARPKLLETATVTVLGFPFGAALQTGERHPAVTVSRGSIASLRKSRGVLERVQIDGNINPGNSGGPVVDKSGALIGVTVSKIQGTNIAFAIPSWQVEEILEGRLIALQLAVTEIQGANARLRASAMVNNPLSKIKGVSLLWISRKTFTATPKEGADGTWAQATPNMKEEALTLSEETAASEFVAKEVRQDPLYLIQGKLVRSDGKIFYGAPREVRVDGPPAASTHAPTVPRPAAVPPAPRVTPAAPPPKPAVEKKGSPEETVGTVNETDRAFGLPREKGAGFVRTGLRWSPMAGPPILLWSKDARVFYVLELKGILRKIDLATLKEERNFTAGFPATLLARSSEGLLLYVPGFGEVWVLDEDSLRLKRKIDTGPLRALTGSPVSAIAFACGQNRLYALETSLGRVEKTWECHKLDEGLLGKPKRGGGTLTYFNDPSQAVLSPDGKYLLLSDYGCLNRFRVEGDTLVYEERGAPIATGEGVRLEVSPESKYVALASAAGNNSVAGYPEKKEGIWVYRIGDFQQPVSVMPVSTAALAFDREAGCAYGTGGDGRSVTVFSPRDSSQRSVPIMDAPEEAAVQILVHPEGRKFFWVTRAGSIFWVELSP